MRNEPVLVDTGPLIALYSLRDPCHVDCVDLVHALPVGKAYTCWPVVVEAAYLLRRYPGDRNRLFDALAAEEFVLLPLSKDDFAGMKQVMATYHDQQVDLADAALVHLANRERINAIFTLDRRHFNIYRNDSGKAFHLLPEHL